jgi:hypothetical protein
MGDKEFKLIEPSLSANNYLKKQEVWTMARGAFHIMIGRYSLFEYSSAGNQFYEPDPK